jgi:hypothetical protein
MPSHELRYASTVFELDPDRCTIEASVFLGAPDLTLILTAQAKDPRRRSRYSTPHLHCPTHCPGVASWRDLRDTRTRTDFRFDELFFKFGRDFVILPDTPSTIYLGEYLALNRHRFRFHNRRAQHVFVTWTCHTVDHPRAHRVRVRGRFTLSSVTVWSDERVVSLQDAKLELAQRFSQFTFGKPTRRAQGFEFPLRAHRRLTRR